MTERHNPPEPVSDLEKEGIPDMEGAFPGEAATGVTWDGIVAPGDELKGAEQFGVTASEQRSDEPLSDRVLRETPDQADSGRITADAGDAAHRLVEAEDGSLDDEEADLVGSMPGYDTGGRSPEEAAVYVTGEDDAPGVSWDESPDYIGEEAPGGAANESQGR